MSALRLYVEKGSSVAARLWLACGFWLFLPGIPAFRSEVHVPRLFSDAELLDLARSYRITELPRFDSKERRAAAWGRELFFDTRFSSNGRIGCVTCHQPGLDFTDGRPLALGVGQAARHTPSLINSYAAHWFFWDGRAPSLAAQVQGPMEAELEHGFDRAKVVQVVGQQHRARYEELFGLWPTALDRAALPLRLRPLRAGIELPIAVAHYTLATLGSSEVQSHWIHSGANAGVPPQKFLATHYDPAEAAPAASPPITSEQANAIERVFAEFSWALAQYERGLVARDAPFDRFLERLDRQQAPEQAFSADFGAKEWRGFKIFAASGCPLCHSGPHFTDQQFHNIGLEQVGKDLDLGRTAGLLRLQGDTKACQPEPTAAAPSESCAELEFLKSDNVEFVGAFKTPTLRNVARTAPYMHDGRLAGLSDVLQHYSELEATPAVGHRAELLLPLRLAPDQLQDLEAFLRGLSSRVEDLTLPPPAQ